MIFRFLAHHHPSRDLPIPIEEIIDLQLDISIVPLPGLQRGFEIEAFLTNDCREIYIDEFIYIKRPRRYRSSLAHELGHFILHREIYQAAQFRSVDEWKQFIEAFPKREYSWFEYQAYSFGSLVLVPREELETHAEEAVKMAMERGIEIIDNLAWEYIASYISDVFEVSILLQKSANPLKSLNLASDSESSKIKGLAKKCKTIGSIGRYD